MPSAGGRSYIPRLRLRGLTDTLEMMMLFNDKEATSEETVAAGADDTKEGEKVGQISEW